MKYDTGWDQLAQLTNKGYDAIKMVVEVGGEDIKAQNTYDMLVALQQKVKEVPNGMEKGVIYWEPEGAKSWSGYALSAWGSDGKPTMALKAFLEK